MVTWYTLITGIGITWEAIAVDVGIVILFYALYRVFVRQGKDEQMYASFLIGASNLVLMVVSCCCPMIIDKINSLL